MDFKSELYGIVEQLEILSESYKEETDRLKVLNGRSDDLYHCIEGVTVNKLNPMKLFSELQKVLRERREVKNNILAYQTLLKTKINNLHNSDGRRNMKKDLDSMPKKYHMKYYSKNFEELLDNKEENE